MTTLSNVNKTIALLLLDFLSVIYLQCGKNVYLCCVVIGHELYSKLKLHECLLFMVLCDT
jgi:hypothetical protein